LAPILTTLEPNHCIDLRKSLILRKNWPFRGWRSLESWAPLGKINVDAAVSIPEFNFSSILNWSGK